MDSSACDNSQMLQEYGERKVGYLLNKAANEDSDDEICNELQDDELQEWQMSDAVHMTKKDDIAVIISVDTFNPYYLVKAMDEVY